MKKLLPKIDKGVPLPTSGWKRNRRKYPFADMKVGDSFLVPDSHVASTKLKRVERSIRSVASRNAIKVALRMTHDGLRVWRTA